MALIGNVPQVLYGSVPPTNDIGNDGDTYVQAVGTVILNMWKKAGGAWAAQGDVNPVWNSYAPIITGETGGLSFTSSARYRKIGTVLFYAGTFTIGASTADGYALISVPHSVATGQVANGIGAQDDGIALTLTVGAAGIKAWRYDGTSIFGASAGRIYTFSITYETA